MLDYFVFIYKTNRLKMASLLYDFRYRFKKVNFLLKVLYILILPIRIIKTLFGFEVYVPYVELVITTYCNLNCKGCSALMNCYKEREHISLENNIKSISRMVDSCNAINHLRLLGGETFLYPELYELLCYLKDQDKIHKIGLVTNSTMLIKDERIIEILKNPKFYVSLSNYGSVSRKYDELIGQLKDNNILYEPMLPNFKWIDYGNFKNINKDKKMIKKQFLYCTHKVRSMINGKYFHCFRCSHATYLKLIKLRKKDYVDFLDEKISTKELRKKLYRFIYQYTPYIESCKYCKCVNDRYNKVIGRGIQNEKK